MRLPQKATVVTMATIPTPMWPVVCSHKRDIKYALHISRAGAEERLRFMRSVLAVLHFS